MSREALEWLVLVLVLATTTLGFLHRKMRKQALFDAMLLAAVLRTWTMAELDRRKMRELATPRSPPKTPSP